MQQLKHYLLASLVSVGLIAVFTAPAQAIDIYQGCSGNSDTAVCQASGTDDAQKITMNIVSVILWLISAIAVIVIVIAGLKYITANGDAAKIASAKNTLLYAVIGLLVAMFAQAIVLFVVDWFA